MLKLFLWLRYLRKRKIVFLSIAAVALSAALLIVVSSLFTGFIKVFERSAVETIGDVVLAPPIEFAKYQVFIERLEQTSVVEAATATVSAPGLLHLGKGNVRTVYIWGIQPRRREKVTGFKRFLRKQKDLSDEPSFEVTGLPEKVGGFVGIGIVAEPDKKTDEYDFDAIEKMIGRHVVLTVGTVIDSGAGEDKSEDLHRGGGGDSSRRFKRKVIPFIIADIVFAGYYFTDKNFIYLPIEKLQKILYPNSKSPLADHIQIKLAGDAQVDVALAQIRGVWQAFAAEQLGWAPYLIKDTIITTAKQMQSPLVAEFRKQMGILLLIFGVISLSAILLIFCIFYMIVETRQRDIAIIKSCGTTSSSVALIFVGFGGFVGIIGSAFGVILGYIITKNINTIEEWIRIIFELKLWKSSVYMFSKIPNEIDWGSALIIVSSAVIAAALGALIPAIIAVRTKPVNILRYE